jgi:hypothetical protein
MAMFFVAVRVAAAHENAAAKPGSSTTLVTGNHASLQITGHIKVNQQPARDPTSTIFTGDRIETASSAAVRISAPGLAAYLPANSRLTYSGQELEMCNCGSVDVNALKPVSVIFRDRDLAVSSQGGSAFTMSVANRDLEFIDRRDTTEIAKNCSILTRLGTNRTRSFAGLGCTAIATYVGLSGAGLSTVGAAAAVAAPAAIANAITRNSTNRPPLSSTNPSCVAHSSIT